MKVIKFDHVIIGAGIVGIWLARRLLNMGCSVALVEIGPPDQASEKAAQPQIHFAERENLGVTRARNHGLTGNSKYWGGGLIRNDIGSLCKMFDLDASSAIVDEFLDCYQLVENQLEIPTAPRFRVDDDAFIAKINVLPGKCRNIVKRLLEPFLDSSRLNVYCNTEVEELHWGVNCRVEAATLSSPMDGRFKLVAKHYVLSMGVIDSNIFALNNLPQVLNESSQLIGKYLHDHWSVPIAKMKWQKNSSLGSLYPPKFIKGCIQGSHYEISAECPWGNQAGFLHIQAEYNLIEPYATIKSFLEGRQRELGWVEQVRRLMPLACHSKQLLQLAYGRCVQHQLFVPEEVELNIVLDFESFPSEHNRITIEEGEVKLYWDIRAEDVVSFSSFIQHSKTLIQRWVSGSDLDVEFLIEDGNSRQLENYLKQYAMDGYHLGGGLAVGSTPQRSIINQDFRFYFIENLAVISTATFANPGVANPVETLLAMCERYARSVT